MGQKWVKNAFFQKRSRTKQVFFAHFEPMQTGFGSWKTRFRKTRRYTKVVCCVLNLCTRFFHQAGHGHQTVHAMTARFRKTRRYTKVVCCVLMIHPHTCVGPAIIGKCLENKVSML